VPLQAGCSPISDSVANEVQQAEAIQGIKMFMSFLPAAGTLLSIVFISMYPLSEKKMLEISHTLKTRREQEAL
jgi:GPH family glycoside/pentoside/hexuronide:cation symporter